MSARKSIGRAPQVTVEVTREDIDFAVKRDSGHCMIADAIKRQYPHLSFVSVDIQTIRATDKEKEERYVWLTPRTAQVGLIEFDQGVEPEPINFRLYDGQTLRTRGHRTKRDPATLRPAGSDAGASTMNRVGGQTPPRAALSNAGRIRKFGLKGMKA